MAPSSQTHVSELIAHALRREATYVNQELPRDTWLTGPAEVRYVQERRELAAALESGRTVILDSALLAALLQCEGALQSAVEEADYAEATPGDWPGMGPLTLPPAKAALTRLDFVRRNPGAKP